MTSPLKVPFVDLKAQYSSIKEEIQEVIQDVLESGQFVGGEWVERFEEEFARFVGAKYAITVGSGTVALELALKAANVRAGDEVIVPTNTFIATAEAVSNVGAKPVFVDVSAADFHLDLKSAECLITSKTRAIIPVHLYGHAADLAQMEEFAHINGLAIIEDAAQAHGTEKSGVVTGGSGRLTCFSFYPGKNLGAYGEGGAVTCNDKEQAETIRLLRNHGSLSKYEHLVIGTNGRLDAIQAAILSVKLRHLSRWNDLRIRHAKKFARALAGSSVSAPAIPQEREHNFHLFVVRTRNRGDLQSFLRTRGIDTGIHYPTPLHLTAAYQQLGYPGLGSLPVAEQLAAEIISLPMYPELTDEQIEHVIEGLLDFIETRATAYSFVPVVATPSAELR